MAASRSAFFAASLVLFLQSASAYGQIKIVQAIPTKSFGFLPLFVAQERGFFRSKGLEVSTPVMATGPSIAGLLSGEVHLAPADTAMRAWIADNAKNAGRKDEVRVSDIADVRLLREAQQELGIRCEGGYACGN